MNKRQAKNEAWNNQRSWGDLKALIRSAREGSENRKSKINKGITARQSLRILMRSIVGHDDDEVPKTTYYSASLGRNVMNHNGLVIQNILRECA